MGNVQEGQSYPIDSHCPHNMAFMWPQNRPFSPKKNSITQDYEVTNRSLGVGINGKVLECYRRTDSQKYALKVGNCSSQFHWSYLVQRIIFVKQGSVGRCLIDM